MVKYVLGNLWINIIYPNQDKKIRKLFRLECEAYDGKPIKFY
ncbi:hypothetical protein Aocu_00420 [Acholeplasma oculi]|uniref:Uncharacterized protein n=1 Tax=Acholeplasma oculi TaxID=35623 RepID=A0A061A890_9MOLU|nr:hypothetical protein Aocu_00420 [Acholeplasma oculi]